MKSPARLTVLLLAMAVGFSGCFSAIVDSFRGMSKELREHGVAAQATILKVWDTGWTVNGNPVVGMRVEVRPADRPAFEATIKKTLISRIDLPQFQPGKVVPVLFDPKDPAVVAVDFGGSTASADSGNPYRDHFVRAPTVTGFLPSPPAPDVYLGTADNVADNIALAERGYALLGASAVEGGSNLEQAVDFGKEIGAAVIVVYGHFDATSGSGLTVLPFHPRPPAPTEPGQSVTGEPAGESIVPTLTAARRVALYFGKVPPPILGVDVRLLNEREKSRLGRADGVAVIAVDEGSPAAAAHIQRGDIIVTIDGKRVADLFGLLALLKSFAGQTVGIDLIRAGAPLSVTAQLNNAAP